MSTFRGLVQSGGVNLYNAQFVFSVYVENTMTHVSYTLYKPNKLGGVLA